MLHLYRLALLCYTCHWTCYNILIKGNIIIINIIILMMMILIIIISLLGNNNFDTYIFNVSSNEAKTSEILQYNLLMMIDD